MISRYRATHPLDEEETKNNIFMLKYNHPRKRYGLQPKHPIRENNMKEYLYDMKNPTQATLAYRAFMARKH